MSELVDWSDIPVCFVIGICCGSLLGGFIGMFSVVKNSFKHAIFTTEDPL